MITVTINSTGDGSVEDHTGRAVRIAAINAEAAQHEAIDYVLRLAETSNQTYDVLVKDQGTMAYFRATPDRTFQPAPDQQAYAPPEMPVAPPPPPANPPMMAPSLPDPQGFAADQPHAGAPTSTDSAPAASIDQWLTGPPAHRAATESPAMGNSDSPTPPAAPEAAFVWADDPEWLDIASRPARAGWRAPLTRVFNLGPGAEELAQRRADFAGRKEAEAAEVKAKEDERRRNEEDAIAAEKAAAETRAREEAQAAKIEAQRQARSEKRARKTAAQERVIQTNYEATRTILVANPKGGARKTTTTYLLAASFGSVRGGSTVAWDANETMGTLGEQSQPDRHSRTVVDLLEHGAQHFLDIDSARVGILDSYVRSQGNAHFDVLASDEDPNRQDQINADGFDKVHDILAHFYRMIVIDTGNNIRAEHFVAAQRHAHQLVIPVAANHASKNRALDMMAAFTSAGYDDLVANAVVLVHELEPIARGEDGEILEADGDHELTAKEISDAFENRVRTVLPIPYDPVLKDGGRIDYFSVSSDTVDAYRAAGVAVAQSLLDHKLAGENTAGTRKEAAEYTSPEG